MDRRWLACLTVAVGLAVVAAACASVEDAPGDPTLAPRPRATGQAAASPSPPSDSVVTETGVRGFVISDPGSVLRVCETDAFVTVRGGRALGVAAAPAAFRVTAGEPILHSTGEPMAQDDPTLVELPVMRDAQGRLVLGWRHCEERQPPTEEPSP